MNIPDEAVEAVTEAIEPYVALGKYVPDAARAALSAALSAALPAIERAHLERLAAEARSEAMASLRSNDLPATKKAAHTLFWLAGRLTRARLDQTKEKP
jgi:hypothetical protein